MAIALVNQNVGSATTANNATATITGTVAGNLIVAIVARSTGATGPQTSVTDSASQTWTVATRGQVSGSSNTHMECWYKENSASITSVTFNASVTGSYAWNISQWSGMAIAAPVDVVSPDNSGNTTATSHTTPAITTTNADDLVIGAAHFSQTTAPLTTAGFTALTNFDDAAAGSGRAAYQIVTATGTYSVNWSPLGVTRAAGVITVSFKAAAVAAAARPESIRALQAVQQAANW